MELNQFQKSLKEDCQLTPDHLIVVGVSGGPDSLCLLDGLHRLNYPVLAVHFDHRLRPESAEDAARVEAIAKEMGVSFVCGRGDIRSLAQVEKLSIEEAARKARYQFLFEQARLRGAQAVAVAHTADDQVETILMHLLRGAGLSGLKGMVTRAVFADWDPRIPLIRPLLNTWRVETEAWCVDHDLEAIYDPSNLDPQFFRNRLRHELIPFLQSYNLNIKEVIWRMAKTLAADWEVLSNEADQAWQRCWLEDRPHWVGLSLAQLQDLPLGLQRAVMRRAIGRLRPALRDIEFMAVERGLEWLRAPENGQWQELAAGLRLWVEWGRVYVIEGTALPENENWPQLQPGEQLMLNVPGEVRLAHGWHIRAYWGASGDESSVRRYFLVGEGVGRLDLDARLDAEKLDLPLVVRGLKAGERLAPLGMEGHSLKLSDYFVNRKIPQRARENWPLICSGDEVAWIAGLRLSELFKVEDHTHRIVHLEILRIESVNFEYS